MELVSKFIERRDFIFTKALEKVIKENFEGQIRRKLSGITIDFKDGELKLEYVFKIDKSAMKLIIALLDEFEEFLKEQEG